MALASGAYCTIDDVTSSFPQFQRTAYGSIQDTEIQSWIDDRKSRIRSVLLARGFDPDAVTLTGDQSKFLRALNRDGASADFGDALQSTITLQPGEYSVAAARRKSFELVIKEINQGLHDGLFQPDISRTTEVGSLFSGVGGAEVDPGQTPVTASQTRFFGRSQVF